MNTTNKNYLIQFLDYLKNEKRYSNNTIIAYEKDLEDYINFLENEQFGNVDEITERIAEFYSGHMRDSYTPRTISRKASAIKSFYHYFVDIMKKIEKNPWIDVTLPKVEKKLPKFVYEDEIKSFLSSINTENDLGKRDKLIFELLYGSGLRVSELTSMKIRDVSLEDRTIIVHGKGSKDRLVPMTKESKKDFETYIVQARPVFLSRNRNMDNEFVFLNFHGSNLTTRGVRDILNRVLEETSSTLKVSPHAFRHSFATHLLNKGMDVRMVQELLGHSNLSTTQIYTKISKENLQETYNKAFPKGKDHHD